MNTLNRRPLKLRAGPQTAAFNRAIGAQNCVGEFCAPMHKPATTPPRVGAQNTQEEFCAPTHKPAKTRMHVLLKTRGESPRGENFEQLDICRRNPTHEIAKELKRRIREKIKSPAARAWLRAVTFDNGKEFAEHQRLSAATGIDVYFAHPYAAWERGTNEHTNGLVRQYAPKGNDFTATSHRAVAAIQTSLNDRPHKRHDDRTPREVVQLRGHRRDVALEI